MPLNLPLRPLASACRSYVIHSKAFFSTSRVKAGTSSCQLRSMIESAAKEYLEINHVTAPGFTKSNASNDLLDFENSRTSNASSSPSKTSRKNIALDQIIQNTNALGGVEKRTEEFTEAARLNTERDAVARFQSRKWKIGDVYSPHDMSPSEMYKWSQPRRPSKDVIDILGINPLDHYKVRADSQVLFQPLSRILYCLGMHWKGRRGTKTCAIQMLRAPGLSMLSHAKSDFSCRNF